MYERILPTLDSNPLDLEFGNVIDEIFTPIVNN